LNVITILITVVREVTREMG